MTWQEEYPSHRQPDMEPTSQYVDSPCWKPLCSWLEKTYQVPPRIEYSRCSMQGGWNVKYKKGSRAVCTLYREKGHFICMVSMGLKEAPEAELALNACTDYVRELYHRSTPFNGGRWLMIEVRREEVLEDVKESIGMRMRKRKRK